MVSTPRTHTVGYLVALSNQVTTGPRVSVPAMVIMTTLQHRHFIPESLVRHDLYYLYSYRFYCFINFHQLVFADWISYLTYICILLLGLTVNVLFYSLLFDCLFLCLLFHCYATSGRRISLGINKVLSYLILSYIQLMSFYIFILCCIYCIFYIVLYFLYCVAFFVKRKCCVLAAWSVRKDILFLYTV